MLQLLGWLAIAIAVLLAAYVLTQLSWHPERNIARAQLGHWFRSLIRLYESDALVRISERRSLRSFSLLRRGGEGSRCRVVLSCPCAGCPQEELRALREAISAEPELLVLREPSDGPGCLLDVQIPISDIWSRQSADVAVRLAESFLDAIGASDGARFDLEFVGERCTERVLEARRRQREGSLPQW